MRTIFYRSIVSIIFVAFLIVVPSYILIETSGDEGLSKEEQNSSRIMTKDSLRGGFWYDDFSNEMGIYNITHLNRDPIGISLNHAVFQETFESYLDSTDLFSTGNWTRHLNMDAGTFLTDKSRPFGALTNTIGNHFNGDTNTHSVVLSNKFNVQSGIFEIWAATNKIDPNYDTTTGFWLMGDDTDAPTGAHRVIATSFTSGGFDIYDGQWHSIAEDLSINTWYRIVIKFDCNIQKGDIYIYDTDGDILGSLVDFNLLNSYPSLKRYTNDRRISK